MEPNPLEAVPTCCNFSTRFDARLDAVPAAQAFLAQALRRNGVAPDLVARAELILEELFRNSVLHGYHGDSAHSVWIGGDGQGPGFWYEDEAAPFNPLEADIGARAPDGGRAIEDQPVGGVGLLLIRKMARSVTYAWRDGRNHIAVSC
ncbi:MAG: ATP-binding protein [Pseudomonadota bacterium]